MTCKRRARNIKQRELAPTSFGQSPCSDIRDQMMKKEKIVKGVWRKVKFDSTSIKGW